jgi:hypothetical protein
MSGTISLSLTQQFDALGEPLAGGLLYFRQAGTVATPQNAFQDAALTIPHPNPITLNAAGRVPQFYLADGTIKILLTDRYGIEQITADNILVVGPSGGGGGGGGVDPTTVFGTGDLKCVYGTAIISGWVRLNGRTIGNSTSGATERANADCQALFTYLWNADSGLSVSGGRGISGAADWAANKTINLPDCRTRAPAGLADMGNSALDTFGGVTFARGNATSIGAILGNARVTLVTANFPPYTPTGSLSLSTSVSTSVTTTVTSSLSAANVSIPTRLYTASVGASDLTHLSAGNNAGADAGTTNWSVSGTVTSSASSPATSSASTTGSFTGNAQGGTSTAFDSISPYFLVTFYIKL